MAAESEFGEDEIAAQGTDNIQDLFARLAPFIDGSGEEPVILINGKPAGFDRSILFYPPEALDRLAVLKPEAAAIYGEPAGKRVVNLVLKKNFSMLNADARIEFATAGGQFGGTLSAMRTAISGDTRWNAQARIGSESALKKSARDLPPRSGVFDEVGFIAAPGGGEIDPALSAATGRPVNAAAIPPGALTAAPSLHHFAAAADALHPVDPDRFETLRSARRNAGFNLGITRPIGDFSAALNLNASHSSSAGKRGLPMASVVLPASHPWSPFSNDVILTRPFAGNRPLRIDNDSTSFGASLTLNGTIGGWQASLAASYSHNRSHNLFETGIDTARVQQLINAADPSFNPFGRWNEGLMIATRNRTISDNLSGRINIRKTLIDLPAGPLTWNLTANTARNSSRRRQRNASGDEITADTITRSQSSGQMSVSVPISRSGEAATGWLGDLSIDLTAKAQTMERDRPQKGFGSTVIWSPQPAVQFRGSIDLAENAPSFEQLDAPIVTTVHRVFDYARQEIAETIWVTGGNPDLKRGTRQSLSLNATLRLLGDQRLTLSFGYNRTIAKGGLASFPELTPAIETAFPERITRNAEGRLVAVDARAINIARNTDATLSSGLALRLGENQRPARGTVAVDPLQFSISVNHRMRLKSELLTHRDLSATNLLAGSGQSRHSVSVQITAGKRGIGATLNGNWSDPANLSAGMNNFRLAPPMLFNLSLFAEPDRLPGKADGRTGVKGFKLSLDIQNLFNGYRRVTRDDGSTPAGYSRDEIDPVGRTVKLSVRKRF
ncbi:MAG: hypothetical protein U0S50_16440 [Sphingopyxis sp.]|uniref:hypothetical protein n=1 Tax=Sphingopyxis sp. TaxID=1908224 RepID=UPI002ABA7651|nr:hypothetical protein [Sphingopyxis sp.]MDZ3833382.1 hypothetical protein [Sphingopyxis sp.]